MITTDSAVQASFYDELAPHYHLLYADWTSSIATQGESLARLLEAEGVRPQASILDAACGIGTQTIGLAQHGFVVSASDISPGAVNRLRLELEYRGLQVATRVDDLRSLSNTRSCSMAAVLACDNSLPHLLSDDELLVALRSCFRCLHPGGVTVFSVRDYAAMPRRNPDIHPYGLQRLNDTRFLAVQVWEWDGDLYDLRMYLTTESANGECATRVLRSRYYAVTIDRLLELMQRAGFIETRRLDNVLFQPVLIGRRPHAA